MKNILICMIFVVVAFCATNVWAATAPVTVNVNATVPTMDGLSVSVSKVIGDVWTTGQASINFGTLVWHPENGADGNPMDIFLPTMYYAVDIGVLNNSTDWTVTHTRASLAGQGTNIDDKVNVSFNKQTSSTVGTELQKVSFANSQNIAYTKAQLAGGWLRIYYGVGTGDPAKPDATGVTPIGIDTPAGTYTGSVTITLTP